MAINRYVKRISYIVLIIFLTTQGVAFAADIWSEPIYTEQWSEPIYTEQWTEPETTEIWSTPSTYIKLQIGSNNALIQGKSLTLDVAPIVIDGRTMVPIRFIAEALGAKIDWDQKTQNVTLTLKGKTIVLTLGKSTALVSGKQITLDVPAISKEGRTLVPIRFISENLDLFVNYINETKTIEISDQPISDNSNMVNTDPSYPENDATVDFEKLYGTWYIWTPGSATNLYDITTGNYATHEYNKGADQGKVIINKDGTYSMSHAAWDKGKTIEGKWRLSFPAEINGERVQGIVLLNGITDVDWAVAPSPNGKIRLLYAMKWADGSAIWVFDSELYK